MFINGTEARALLVSPLLEELFGDELLVRLYPIGAKSVEGSKRLISYRAIPQIPPIEPRAAVEGGEGLFDNGCTAWGSVGFWDDSDEFTFEVQDGKVVGVTNRALTDLMRSTFKPESED